MTLVEAWSRYENLVKSLAWKHCKKHGNTSWDDAYAESCWLFVQAVRRHDGVNSNLTTWLTRKIHYGLLDWRTRELSLRPKRLQRVEMTEESLGRGKRFSFSLPEWMDELTRDARTVVRVILDTPKDVFETAGAGASLKKSLSLLLREAGWEESQIQQAFDEIRYSL